MSSQRNSRTVGLFLVFQLARLFFSLCSESLRDSFIPCHHVLVWLRRETLPWQNLWQDLSSIRILDIPAPHCFHQELRVLIGP